jgi:hypothetical protein
VLFYIFSVANNLSQIESSSSSFANKTEAKMSQILEWKQSVITAANIISLKTVDYNDEHLSNI